MSTAEGQPPRDPPPGRYEPFRPVRARRVAWAVALLSVVVMTTIALALPVAVPWFDRGAFIATGLLMAWFTSRQATVRAVPSSSGLEVRNLFLSRRLEWPEIVTVRFGPDRPWVQLDLADGDTLSVMAIQRSDGAFAEKEARRLATLVAVGSRTERDD
jgi:Bacterial PH domain